MSIKTNKASREELALYAFQLECELAGVRGLVRILLANSTPFVKQCDSYEWLMTRTQERVRQLEIQLQKAQFGAGQYKLTPKSQEHIVQTELGMKIAEKRGEW